jgi:hypothetical protein
VLAIAGVSALLSATAAAGLGDSRHPEPLGSGAHDLTRDPAVPSEPIGTA